MLRAARSMPGAWRCNSRIRPGSRMAVTASGAPIMKRRTDLRGSKPSAREITWRARSRMSATGAASSRARSVGTTPRGWRRNNGSFISSRRRPRPWLTADGETCNRDAARATCFSSSTASNSTSRLRSIRARLVLFSLWVKSYHWFQKGSGLNLRAGGNMHPTNSLLAVTILAAASAPAPAYEPPELFMQPIAERQPQLIDAEARKVVTFWKEAGPALWFAKDTTFDQRFRERFLLLHEAAARGEFSSWQATPEGSLALVILLDQFPRNAFRGTPRMYATDASARRAASLALAAGYDREFPLELRKFFVLPFAHSEDLADQERSVALARRLG